jgi:acyl-coenzyme A synthetase/AMP-(fatty) acid ligase
MFSDGFAEKGGVMRTRSFRCMARTLAAWAALLACLPSGASAGPIASSSGQVKTTREQDVERIERLLADGKVARALERRGVSPNDLRQKLDSMSDQDVHMLAERMDGARAGGQIVGILVIVLLVVLIVYLVHNT